MRTWQYILLTAPALRALSTAAPEEAKAVLQAAMQLMPPERPPSASKRPHSSSQPHQQQPQRPGPYGNQAPGLGRPQQQQPPQFQQPAQQQQQPAQHKAPNGVMPRPVNGMEPMGRWALLSAQLLRFNCTGGSVECTSSETPAGVEDGSAQV
jgi:hypothetical protein